jgi:RNA polymerase sigma-70 factor (ECF subfamily)
MSNELIPHLFRTEYSNIVAVLCRHFGFEQVAIAEDIASETFLSATQAWGLDAVPANPTAWLYHVAKNKARNYKKRGLLFEQKVSPAVQQHTAVTEDPDIDLSPQNIYDSQLQMMFAICHPSIPAEAQVGLSLRILCGFGIEEIANAFLSNKETINKRLFRAKEKLRQQQISIILPPVEEMAARLESVLTTIYLLFNEGYYSVSQDSTVRKDLCFEAMRLCSLLLENQQTNQPSVNALLSLMCFHASRFDARINKQGELILYEEQDAGLWNTELISKGIYFLSLSASGNQLSRYHLEAGIGSWHTQKNDSPEKWEGILQLYDQLIQIAYSPVAALNRTYALSKVKGKEAAIEEAEKLQLHDNQFYFSLLGELYNGIDNGKAKQHFEKALLMTTTVADRQALERKINTVGN